MTKSLNGRGVGDVEGLGKNLGVVLLSDLLRGGLQGLLVAGAHGNTATLGGECFRGGAADPLAGSGNEGHTIFQAEIHGGRIIKGSEPNARLLRRKNATLRAARPDPSLRKERLLGMTSKLCSRFACGSHVAQLICKNEVSMKRHTHHSETKAVRGAADLEKKNGPMATPIYQTSTFEVTDNDEQVRATGSDHYYTRYGNPTNTVAEKTIAELEGVDAALTFASGMGAITTTIMALLKSGDHIVAQRDIYGGANKFLSQWLPKMGIETTLVDTTEYDQHARAIRPNTKLLYVESPTNPTLRVVDFKKVAALAKQHKLLSMIDATFGTPINQHPAEFGIDLVMHSGTKYLAGHSDLICGVVAGRHELMERIWETRTTLGNCMDPHASWVLVRGLKTLAVRVARQNENAQRVAEFLSEHAKVRSVQYPFLKSHPQYGRGAPADERWRRSGHL